MFFRVHGSQSSSSTFMFDEAQRSAAASGRDLNASISEVVGLLLRRKAREHGLSAAVQFLEEASLPLQTLLSSLPKKVHL